LGINGIVYDMGKKKIALVHPFYDSEIVTPPLGIGYLSSFLMKNGYDVMLIDALKDKLVEADVLRLLRDNYIDVLGITCLSSFYKEAVSLCRYVREQDKTIKTIIGGLHPTFLPFQTLTESGCDYVICGEGEKALLELLDNNFDNANIRGVYTLKELSSEKTPFEKAEPVQKLDDLPFPDWEQMQPGSYPVAPHGTFIKDHPVGIITSSRGCPYSCKFCSSPNFYDHKIRFRSAENVVEEIKLLADKYRVKEIHFEDDNLTLNRRHVTDICELILKNGIKVHWSCPNGIRVDKIDDELIKLMKKSGFYACGLGIESASEDILKGINKNQDLNAIKNAIRILRNNKIEVCGFFIFGLPGENKGTMRETVKFALQSGLTRVHFGAICVNPGCDLFKELEGRFIPDFSTGHRKPNYASDGLTLKEIMSAQTTAIKKFYLRPRILLNCVKYIKFAHLKSFVKRLKGYHVFGGVLCLL